MGGDHGPRSLLSKCVAQSGQLMFKGARRVDLKLLVPGVRIDELGSKRCDYEVVLGSTGYDYTVVSRSRRLGVVS